MPRLIAIAAMSPSRGIGYKGALPWRLPEDLAWFKEKTMGHTLLMGRKTFEGLPKKLQGRNILVYSTTQKGENVIGDLKNLPDEEIWVCGGAQLYAATLPLSDEVYLTLVKAEPAAVDTYLPVFENHFASPTLVRESENIKILHYKK